MSTVGNKTASASIRFDSVDHTLIMSVKDEQDVSEMINRAKDKHQTWLELIQNTISKLYSFANDIQELERSIKKGAIVCSSIGWVSGVMTAAGILGAPFTFGGSLSLTAVGTSIGLCSGAADIVYTWSNNCEIKSKCDEVCGLLKDVANLTTELADLVVNLQTIQNAVCSIMEIDHISLSTLASLGAVVSRGCESLVTLMSRNIPNIGKTSKSVFVRLGGKTTEKVSAPIFGKVATGIAKKSFRVIGTVAVGIALVADVKNILDNVGALKEGKLSDVVIGIYDAVKDMKNQVRIYDKVFDFTS